MKAYLTSQVRVQVNVIEGSPFTDDRIKQTRLRRCVVSCEAEFVGCKFTAINRAKSEVADAIAGVDLTEAMLMLTFCYSLCLCWKYTSIYISALTFF